MNEEVVKPQKKTKEKKQKLPKSDRKRGKFNFIDAFILLLIIAVIAVVFFVYSPADIFNFGTEKTQIIYTVRISGVSAEYVSMISVGDAVADSDGNLLGIVAADVEREEHYIYEYRGNASSEGGISDIQHPELVDIIVTISAEADKKSDGYIVDGKRIAIEKEYQLVFPKVEGDGICLSLSEEGKADQGGAK